MSKWTLYRHVPVNIAKIQCLNLPKIWLNNYKLFFFFILSTMLLTIVNNSAKYVYYNVLFLLTKIKKEKSFCFILFLFRSSYLRAWLWCATWLKLANNCREQLASEQLRGTTKNHSFTYDNHTFCSRSSEQFQRPNE